MAILTSTMLAGSSGSAMALSSMPGGPGNPIPFIALIIVLALYVCAFFVFDRLEQHLVDHMKKTRDVAGLVGALKNSWLARKSACALGDVKAVAAVGPLVEALHDKNGDVRQAAAKALGEIGDRAAVAPLTGALGDEFQGVRECASYALKKLRTRDTTHDP